MPSKPLRSAPPRGVVIEEMPEGAQVAKLHLRNPTSSEFFLPSGLLFDGGWQHRTLVHSVLVKPHAELELDVRCVEQGRWGGSGGQSIGARKAPLAVLGALRGLGHDRGDASGDVADQSDVWSRVKRYEDAYGASASASVVEVAERADASLRSQLRSVPVLPGQRGVLVGLGGHPVVLEVFDHPRALKAQWNTILDAVVADAALLPEQPTPGYRARAFAARVSMRHLQPSPTSGRAGSVEARDDLVAVEALVADSTRLVHLTALNVRHELVGAGAQPL